MSFEQRTGPAAETRPEIEQLDSRVVYRSRWMTLREDRIRRADGSEGTYGVVEKRDFAVVAAVEDGHVHLVEQYRYPVGARHWELPQGVWDGGDDPAAQARAELREETGVLADEVLHAGRLYLAYGLCTQAYDVWLARGLRQGSAELEPEEQGLIARRVPLVEVERMMRDGELVDGVTVAAFGLLRLKGLL